jgi:hypothetical protein
MEETTMDLEALNARIARLEAQQRELADRQAIRDCVTRYTRGLDRLDVEMVRSAFHDDALNDHGVVVKGPDFFADWAVEEHRRDAGGTLHYIATHSCELDGDVAHAETYWLAAVRHPGGTGLTFAGGRWLDRLERRGGEWKVAARKLVQEFSSPPMLDAENEISAKLREAAAKSMRDRTDPSYERPLTIDPARIGYRHPDF